jgi:hypothetical protein
VEGVAIAGYRRVLPERVAFCMLLGAVCITSELLVIRSQIAAMEKRGGTSRAISSYHTAIAQSVHPLNRLFA